MKKFASLFISLLTFSLFSTQISVVGEVFTQSW